MNELVSFFRFIIPGIIYLGLSFICIIVYDHTRLICLLKNLDNEFVAGIVGLFFVSGCVGYIFSLIYRFFSSVHFFDQTNLVNELMNKKIVTVLDKQKTAIKPIVLTSRLKFWKRRKEKIRAYEIINIFWHLNHTFFDKDKTNFQASILNSLGAIFVASIFSLITFFIYIYLTTCYPEFNCKFLCTMGILLIFLLIVGYHFRQTKRMYERWVNSTFYSVALKEKSARLMARKKSQATTDRSSDENLVPSTFIHSITYFE